MRVDRVGRHHPAGSVDHRHLHAGAQPRIQAHGGSGAGGRGQQQIPQVLGEHPYRLVLGRLPQPSAQIHRQPVIDPGAPGPADRIQQPAICRPAGVSDPESGRDPLLVLRPALRGLLRFDAELQHFFLLAPEHGQNPVGRQAGKRLGEGEVVGELGPVVLPPGPDRRGQPALAPQPLPKLADQVGILGVPLDQDRASPIQGCGRVGIALSDEGRRRRGRFERRISQQPISQWFQPGLPGELGLGPAFLLERQVDVFQPGLGVGGADALAHGVVKLALAFDRLEDRGPAFLQLAQVTKPLLQRSELNVVQAAGGLLAVTRHERHGGPGVQQVHRCCHLGGAHAQFGRDLFRDGQGWLRGRHENAA